jgi:hypothetical protein
MARGPSSIQRLVSLLTVLCERDTQRHTRGTLVAMESRYEHMEVLHLARKCLVNERSAVQSLNIGFDLVPDKHLIKLIEQYEAEETQLAVLGERVAQMRRSQGTANTNGNGNGTK